MRFNVSIDIQRSRERLHWLRWLRIVAFVWLGALAHGQASAQYISSCAGPNPGTFVITLPTDTYAVPRDNSATGVRIGPWTPFYAPGTGTSVWTCDTLSVLDSPAHYWGVSFISLLGQPVGTYSEGGVTYPVFKTNVAGIGIVMGSSGYESWASVGGKSGWTNEATGRTYGYPVDASWSLGGAIGARLYTFDNGVTNYNYAISGMPFGMKMDFAFIKIGPVTGGTINMPGVVAQAGVSVTAAPAPYTNYVSPPQNLVDVTLVGGPTFAPVACATPDVTVPMGTHANTEFSGVGPISTAPASFNISLNNCPAGINSIKYEIDAVTTIVDASQSVVALDSASTARGVGVQLLDANGNALPIGTQQTLPGYDPAGGNYTIPLKARYYQTTAPVLAGSANTVMTFTMNYQ
ncbi:major type 1 subunit fimbrin (pilin) [Paraburkholderia diazotrophica]|uniref:Major type 1 subunit fimbrin (Pilin) n=1 Tax=Paraburkholderia diazotrophica TaxID=667676 RepID=A0A1H7BV34_9BURK|nr:major type 1 subunit fimbrin (pilin) [Paraburkholderia diazotrophica]